MLRALLFLFISFASSTYAQSHRVIVKDLRETWRTQKGEAWVTPATHASYKTIYFSIDAAMGRGKCLEIRGIDAFSVWYGGKLIGSYQGTVSLSLDSLTRIHSGSTLFGVHAKRGVEFVKTQLVIYSVTAPAENLTLRERPYFLNFCILAVLLLALYFVALFQSNPKSIMDYFNFSKLLSIQERDETLAAGRITSSINLIVYAFIGLCFSFLLTIILHFTSTYFVASNILSFSSVAGGVATWLKLSALVVGALWLKMAVILFTTRLFKFREAYAIQVLNFFRHLSFTLVLFSITIVIYFIARIDDPIYYKILVQLLGWLLIGWIGLVFFKLLNKSPFSGFHLFSYLCATEIFPLVIFFEILFF